LYLLITYDIANNRHREKIADLLLNAGLLRVQKSVFEGEIKTSEFRKLKSGLKKYVSKKDTIRYYVLCKKCQKQIRVSGYDPIASEQNEINIF